MISYDKLIKITNNYPFYYTIYSDLVTSSLCITLDLKLVIIISYFILLTEYNPPNFIRVTDGTDIELSAVFTGRLNLHITET